MPICADPGKGFLPTVTIWNFPSWFLAVTNKHVGHISLVHYYSLHAARNIAHNHGEAVQEVSDTQSEA